MEGETTITDMDTNHSFLAESTESQQDNKPIERHLTSTPYEGKNEGADRSARKPMEDVSVIEASVSKKRPLKIDGEEDEDQAGTQDRVVPQYTMVPTKWVPLEDPGSSFNTSGGENKTEVSFKGFEFTKPVLPNGKKGSLFKTKQPKKMTGTKVTPAQTRSKNKLGKNEDQNGEKPSKKMTVPAAAVRQYLMNQVSEIAGTGATNGGLMVSIPIDNGGTTGDISINESLAGGTVKVQPLECYSENDLNKGKGRSQEKRRVLTQREKEERSKR